MAAANRTVRVGLIAYRDPAGAVRRAQKGAQVQVHPDDVPRFDSLNVVLGEPVSVPDPEPEPEPEPEPAPEPEAKPRSTRKS